MSNPHSVLACYGLAKTYADGNATIHILKQITLEVSAGEWIAVVGHSGSGKSTFLHLLAGLDRPTRGSVFLNGQDLQKISEHERCFLRNRYLGFVYQFHYLLPEFSALENVGMPLLIRGDDPRRIRERAAYLLEQVGLKDRIQHRPGQLSGGERQRVAIARALVTEPLCILADEPTGNLDPDNADRVLNLFYNLQQSHQTSVVMVTHDLSIANKAKRILRLEAGTID
jgi:lipoprotein-releasing system ATP-binding protein